MKKIKLFILAILVIPLMVALTACGPKNDSSNGNTNNELNNFSNITFESKTYDYDGIEKELKISGTLPDGSTVTYQNNKATNAGTYDAVAEIKCDGYNTLKLNAKLTINKINYDMSNVSWNYAGEFTYDGTEKSVLLQNLPNGVSVRVYENNAKTNAGNYTATASFNFDEVNHNAPIVQNLNWTISKATLQNIDFNDTTVEYDTMEHSIELVGNIPENSIVKITYDNEEVTGKTEVGTYTAHLLITNPNYYDFEKTAKLTIKSTEKQLFSAIFNGKIYFQNDLDGEKLYVYSNGNIEKVNNDIPEYFVSSNNSLYYFSSSLFSKTLKSFDGKSTSKISDISGEYLATDGTYLYYAVNNLALGTDKNGIYKLKLDGSSEAPVRIVKDKAKYLNIYNNEIFYANASDGNKLYKVSANASEQETGTLLFDEKVSYLIQDSGVLYFNSTKTKLGVPTASAIRKFIISSKTCVKLSTDAGKYLTKIGSDIYYINSDKITSEIFGDGIYKISSLISSDSNLPGTKVLSSDDNGYSSLTAIQNKLYYYKLNNKHLYCYDLSNSTEKDLMANFVVPESQESPSGYAKIAEHNGEIYYTDPLDNNCLYKYNPLTKTRLKVLSESVSGVYFNENYMYYSTYVLTQYALWRMNLNTNDIEKISSSRCDNLIFDNETIYYIKVGSLYNNYIMKMNLDGTNVQKLYDDKNLWVASFEKIDNYLYFTINPKLGKKYIYRLDLSTNEAENLSLRSNYMIISNNIIYYYNIEDSSICAYNISSQKEQILATSVNVNNMIILNGKLYFSSTSSNYLGLYSLDLTSKKITRLSDKCAESMTIVSNKIYFLQVSNSYTSDYPTLSNGNGCLYYFDGTKIVKA